MSPDSHAKLRIEGQKLNEEIKAKKKLLDTITAELLKGDPGKFPECTVVGESTQVIVPEGEDHERVKELAGEHYDKLFERVTSWKCVKGFGDVVNALFKTQTANAILKRCSKVKSGFVKWN
ncbi:hypothetical protein [Prosthecobacter sp.]|uniref:hypothetical protein n=1 Tax=Prosthecobacter sp. TaxID=1965333 RepID=UPI0037837B77